MRKGFLIIIAMGVCALLQVTVTAQSFSSLPNAISETASNAVPAASSVARPFAVTDLRARLDEARELLKSQSNLAGGSTVALAVFDRQTSQLDVIRMAKDSFLTKGLTLAITSQSGRALNVTIVRANGVNTAVRITDAANGSELTPLTVAFPIVKGGSLTEVAYYSSAHPAVVTNDVAGAGETYISTMLDNAAHELEAKGIHVSSDIVDIAEHLCVVEHTDHRRFMTEDHTALLPEIVSLYALNRGNTFRYSVSTAGAGGMIQMIPRTYDAIRQQHASVPLKADFVEGMRDHANALQAMLLYMNDTWTNLAESSEVQDALRNGVATKPELLAAGYNSNPGRLPTYLKNDGTNWRTLIPAETQMYLAIYSEVDRNISFPQHGDGVKVATANNANLALPTRAARMELFLTWMNGLFARVL
jgi:hypothetical protein